MYTSLRRPGSEWIFGQYGTRRPAKSGDGKDFEGLPILTEDPFLGAEHPTPNRRGGEGAAPVGWGASCPGNKEENTERKRSFLRGPNTPSRLPG